MIIQSIILSLYCLNPCFKYYATDFVCSLSLILILSGYYVNMKVVPDVAGNIMDDKVVNEEKVGGGHTIHIILVPIKL